MTTTKIHEAPKRSLPEIREGTEIELKLTAEPRILNALWDCARMRECVLSEQPERQIVNIYYDTSDGRFRRRELSFRVRERDGHYIQTVKLGSDDGTVQQHRQEWESIVPSAAPCLERITDPVVRERIGFVAPGQMRAIFRTNYRRQIRLLNLNASGAIPVVVEAARDIGTITSDGRTVPISEIELELVKGSSASLFDFALSLLPEAPFRVELQSKSARGYAVASGERPSPKRLDKVDLDAGWPIDTAIEWIFKGCFEGWMANEAAAFDGRDPEGVHQMRVALRRMRSALLLFKDVLPEEQRNWLAQDAKWLINSLGPARDWDVFLADVLHPVRDARPDDGQLIQIRDAAEQARQSAYVAVRHTVESLRYTRFVLSFASWLDRRRWRDGPNGQSAELLTENVMSFARRQLNRRLTKARKLGRGFEALPAEELHQLRIALKKLRYSVEFFGSLYPRNAYRPYRKSLARLQDQLGHLNDISVTETLLQTLTSDCMDADRSRDIVAGSNLVIGWYLNSGRGARADAARGWKAFTATKPYWKESGKAKRQHVSS